MAWTHPVVAFLFFATFLLLALGRIGKFQVPRGVASLVGGVATALLLGLSPAVIDVQVMGLLAGLMILAAMVERAGVFAGMRRKLMQRPPVQALWLSLVVVGLASAVLLNDAAVVVLVPFFLPMYQRLRLPLAPSVVLAAVAANLGSLLTPFGNPQNAVLASVGNLGLLDFLQVQTPIVLVGYACLALACYRLARHVTPSAEPLERATPTQARAPLVAVVVGFVAAAAWGLPLGYSALVAAAIGMVIGFWRFGTSTWKTASQGLDWNVLALFVGLYFLTAGLPAWFPVDSVPMAKLNHPLSAGLATTALSNLVGNVPAMLLFSQLDAGWTAAHAPFLVTVSTLGGALLLTGSAASLIAADQARKFGVELRFGPFMRDALWILPALLCAFWTW